MKQALVFDPNTLKMMMEPVGPGKILLIEVRDEEQLVQMRLAGIDTVLIKMMRRRMKAGAHISAKSGMEV